MDKSGMGAGCGCGCVGEKPPQDENAMRFMIGSGAAYLLYLGIVMWRSL